MKRLAILFPGQGSQYIGMGKSLAKKFSIAAEVFEEVNETLGFNLRNLIFEGDAKRLTHSANAQPAVVAMSCAMFRVYMKEFGIRPHYVAGHSLGEISALITAEAISLSDGIRLSRKRGTLMHQAYTQQLGRAAIVMGLSIELVEEEASIICESGNYVTITGYNSPSQILIAGTEKSVWLLAKRIREHGGEFVPLSLLPMKVDAPYHTTLMSFLYSMIEEELRSYKLSPLQYDVISSVTGLPYESHDDVVENLSLQLISPVRWTSVLSYLEKHNVEIAVDVGPQFILKTLLQENGKRVKAFSFDIESDRTQLQHEFELWRITHKE